MLAANVVGRVVPIDAYGVYRLYREEDGDLAVRYVGRGRVQERVLEREGAYDAFDWATVLSSDAEGDAFLAECQMYHSYGPENLENEIHPEWPDGRPDLPACSQKAGTIKVVKQYKAKVKMLKKHAKEGGHHD